jgi:hypothetical protein
MTFAAPITALARVACATLVLACASARAQDAAPRPAAVAPVADAPVADAQAQAAPVATDAAGAWDPEAPTMDDRFRAATSAGVVAFVGLTLGGVGIPGALGVVASAVGGLLPEQALYIAAVVGGASGAAAGGAIGSLPLVKWYGIPLVGLAAAAGACVGLVPTAFLAYAAAENPPDVFDSLNPLVVGQSASLVLAMAAGAGAAAVVAGLFAEKREIEGQ